ncbi:hypothetical protein GCM10010399_44190 [Dactylosporangium fulvum]|uniref:Uncharacterized protein n=1 Tax=Dactylosporangium fulvum TaxID=53359 RepID=A0ABY5W757_9ACTN|nr:hypothetical protein [Dactylosporangium fulvum]UWP85913.1 hypothetical protein Dfulv_17340 [Dactylosporangium fulvum]
MTTTDLLRRLHDRDPAGFHDEAAIAEDCCGFCWDVMPDDQPRPTTEATR